MSQRRTKHIGIVGCASESAVVCYRTVCLEAGSALGEHLHPEVSLHNHAPGGYLQLVRQQAWQGVAQLLLSSAQKLARAGAEILICPDDTVQPAVALFAAYSPLPCLQIAAEVAREAHARGYRRLAIVGTRAVMESPLYAEQLRLTRIDQCSASLDQRIELDAIILGELVHGNLSARSRQRIHELIERLVSDQQCDALVLGCTELSLLMAWDRAPVPVLDPTRLLARAALRAALG